MSSQQRSGADNGIWLCQTCSKLIDSDSKYTIEMLDGWRAQSERATVREIQTRKIVIPREAAPMLEDMEGNVIELAQPTSDATLAARIHAASSADISRLKQADTWPKHAVSLGLTGRDEKGEYQITDLGSTIRTVRELSIISQPGTGKTTTLIQAAESILTDPFEAVGFVRLGNWAHEGRSLIDSIANKAAFDGLTARDILKRAEDNRLTLLLDGWNELDRTARGRAASEVENLRMDYPFLRIVISTRRQATELPISGVMIEVQALSDDQQMEIAQNIAGDDGVRVVDSAWRTKGVRDLVAIPLYLHALLANTPGGTLPTTKEEVLRLFIEGHERKRQHATALRDILEDSHRPVLIRLAVAATPSGNTYLSDEAARAIVSTVERELSDAGQLSIAVPSPTVVLDTLVSHHVIVRSRDGSVGFQHQQFQEWHASFDVEKAILASSAGDYDANELLVSMLNAIAWEEPILFACERLSRTQDHERDAVAKAIIEAISIDPMLAAEMIHRSSAEVWSRVEAHVKAFVARWHAPDRIDRAIRFAIVTGRPEFSELLWPFIATTDSQSYLRVLRHAPQFRPSALGVDCERRLAGLPADIRSDVLSEIAGNSGMDGMELVTKLAKADPDVYVQLSVVHALLFRRGIRLASEILRNGPDELWEMVAMDRWATDFPDRAISDRIRKLQIDQTKRENDKPKLLLRLIEPENHGDLAAGSDVERAVYDIIVAPTFPVDDGHAMYAVGKAHEKFPGTVRDALIQRFIAGASLSFRGDELLHGGKPIDTGPIPEMVFSKKSHDRRAAIATSLIGRATALRMLGRLFELFDEGHATGRGLETEGKAEYWAVERRMDLVPAGALARAWLALCDRAEPKHYAFMADLWATHGEEVGKKGMLVLEESTRREISKVLRRWAEALIADASAKRNTMAAVAKAIGRMGLLEDLDIVERLLDEDISRKAKQLAGFIAGGGRSDPTQEARMGYGNQYREAFSHFKSQASSKVLEKYLTVPLMAKEAAFAMKDIQDKRRPPEENRWTSGELNASEINERRRAIAEGRHEAEPREATAIFAVVDRLTANGTTEDQHKLAFQIVSAATYMPHKRRPELTARLLTLPVPWVVKLEYMRALAWSGETLRADYLMTAIAELFERAQKQTWLLQHNQAYELHDWLRLFPFSDHPERILEAWNMLPPQLNDVHELERIVRPLGKIDHPHAEDTLFAMAAQNPALYGAHDWVSAVLGRGSETAIIKLLEMADADPKVMGSYGGYAHERQLQELLVSKPTLRATLLTRYKAGEFRRADGPVEKSLAATADAETVLAFVEVNGRQKATKTHYLHGAVEAAVLEHRPLSGNSYEIHGVNASVLRKALFALLDGACGELAKACLVRIDKLRDEHGRVEFEPRHPDIDSKRPWPLEAAQT
ncbi:MAG TPA: hypothetical protein VMH86_06200 [Rhizomicrobium sp.]|nr:hypothetical protein [Rhizomicrobium sp.]